MPVQGQQKKYQSKVRNISKINNKLICATNLKCFSFIKIIFLFFIVNKQSSSCVLRNNFSSHVVNFLEQKL